MLSLAKKLCHPLGQNVPKASRCDKVTYFGALSRQRQRPGGRRSPAAGPQCACAAWPRRPVPAGGASLGRGQRGKVPWGGKRGCNRKLKMTSVRRKHKVCVLRWHRKNQRIPLGLGEGGEPGAAEPVSRWSGPDPLAVTRWVVVATSRAAACWCWPPTPPRTGSPS